MYRPLPDLASSPPYELLPPASCWEELPGTPTLLGDPILLGLYTCWSLEPPPLREYLGEILLLIAYLGLCLNCGVVVGE
jgi:hypothetical protein